MELQFNALLFIAVISAAFLLSFKVPYSKYLAVLIFSLFLIVAPPTAIDGDFRAYKLAFETLRIVASYPYVATSSHLTTEIGFLWYMLPFRFLTENFNYFLGLNFLFLTGAGSFFLKKMGVLSQDQRSVFLLALPALIPVVFYWSPRSAPSLIIILGMYAYLHKHNLLFALLLAFTASLIHSQYIPFIAVLLATFLIPYKSKILVSFVASLLLLMTLKYGVNLIRLLPLGDVYTVAIAKLHYMDNLGSRSGIRPAGIGIIILCISYLTIFRKHVHLYARNEDHYGLKNILDTCIAFSLIANLLFIQDSHVAGRIARFSDFFIIVVGVGYVTKALFHKKYVLPISIISFLSLLALYINVYFIEAL